MPVTSTDFHFAFDRHVTVIFPQKTPPERVAIGDSVKVSRPAHLISGNLIVQERFEPDRIGRPIYGGVHNRGFGLMTQEDKEVAVLFKTAEDDIEQRIVVHHPEASDDMRLTNEFHAVDGRFNGEPVHAITIDPEGNFTSRSYEAGKDMTASEMADVLFSILKPALPD